MFRKANKFGLFDIRQSIDREKLRELPLARRLFFQPLADFLTVWFVNHGWTANGVTMLRGALTGLALIILPFASSTLHVQFFAIFLLFLITLDFVDGNLARLLDTASYNGKYWDGYFDFFLPTFLMPSLGLLLSQFSDLTYLSQLGMALGLVSCFLWFTRERVRSFAHFMRIQMFAEERVILDFDTTETRSEARYASFMQTVRNLSYLLLLIPDYGMSFFCFTAIHSILFLPPWFYLHFKVVGRYLNRHKKSALSSKNNENSASVL